MMKIRYRTRHTVRIDLQGVPQVSYAFKGCISLKTLKSWLLSTDKNTFFNSHTYKVDIDQHFHLSLKSAVLVESVFKSRVDYNRARTVYICILKKNCEKQELN